MKNTMQFTIPSGRPRDHVAAALLDRDGPFKPRSVKRAKAWVRRPKHRGRELNEI